MSIGNGLLWAGIWAEELFGGKMSLSLRHIIIYKIKYILLISSYVICPETHTYLLASKKREKNKFRQSAKDQ